MTMDVQVNSARELKSQWTESSTPWEEYGFADAILFNAC